MVGVTELAERACDYCGSVFAPRRKTQRFCCDDHRYKYHNKREASIRVDVERLVAARDLLDELAEKARKNA